ncbi:lytic transglycosylase domain-containing protein [Anaeromicropila populeti]|uniref:Transglycosylase SLT domain-containing protein n=1 Tax=Anaeromicropila populeti TaxID=37658 RepID=A0A1I6JMB1_9FIRM|nr:lytic transglycosylase domain-containing protein [Anaeromicropila populeti]SFR80112.1 Transglycosylase SLT domain-containing protein [Anaeromicropila populeti]
MVNAVHLEGLTYIRTIKNTANTEATTDFNKTLEEAMSAGEDNTTDSQITLSSVQSPQYLDEFFQKASDKYGVPVELIKAVVKAESNFNANAVSSSGAQGLMQLMPATAEGLGVEDSFDPEQNIMGGTAYLAKMLKQFNGSVKLALAAYNAGPGNVTKYDGIPPFTETQNYVKKILGFLGVSGNSSVEAATASGETEQNTSTAETGTEAELTELVEKFTSQSKWYNILNGTDSSGDSALSISNMLL